jgi:hypothetical protein
MPIPVNMNDLPIVGQVLKVHGGFMTATMTCQCKPGNPPLLLRGVDNLVPCRACGRVFAITKVTYDASKGPQMTLDCSVVQFGSGDGAPPPGN